jgi:preprotein translocase subunit SecA
MLRTIDDKWKDHLYGMDQLREGINLRAYGQKNPLLEYKSEGFKMFQDMMADMNATIIKRLFRTQIQSLSQGNENNVPVVKNLRTSHQDTTGMGFSGAQDQGKSNQPQQVRIPVQVGTKYGRNEKISVRDPDGNTIKIKFKKLDSYLKKGYVQV